jgi:hypothetical protein
MPQVKSSAAEIELKASGGGELWLEVSSPQHSTPWSDFRIAQVWPAPAVISV